MKKWMQSVLLLCALAWLGSVQAQTGQKYLVLCYHSVPTVFDGDPDGVSVLNLARQLAWLRESGYTPIRMQDVIRAKHGMQPLPERAFLLTVDDGFANFYTHVYPLLKLYNVPAVFSVVGRWIEEGAATQNQNDPYFKKQQFVTWPQLKEMADSGLVEVASHSYDLHHGVLANPQGNEKPAAITRRFDPTSQTYETPEQHRQRVANDLRVNADLIEYHLGKPPRIMVWPYGAVDGVGIEEAARVGMPINFTLRDGLASTTDIETVERTLIGQEMPLSNFSYLVKYGIPNQNVQTVNAVVLSLDRIYHPDPEQQDANLGRLIEQMLELEIGKVVLQPFVKPIIKEQSDAKTVADIQMAPIQETYFPNSVLPMRSDLLNRVAWQLRVRAKVDVYLQLPHQALEKQQLAYRTLYRELSQNVTAQGVLLEPDVHPEHIVQQVQYHQPDWLRQRGDGTSLERRADDLPSMVQIDMTQPDEEFNRQIEKIRFFQRMGVRGFLLNDDDFLDHPDRFEHVRSVLSVKDNPLQ
jgi:biofilm PGA synthesis lipoprotein PgaB